MELLNLSGFIYPAAQPICLPDPAQDYDKETALVTGWGRMGHKGDQSNILQKARVTTRQSAPLSLVEISRGFALIG